MELSAESILIAREERVLFQKKLIKRFSMPLVTVRVNFPGIHKENDITTSVIQIIDTSISIALKQSIHFKLFRITEEGPILNLAINEKAEKIKKAMIDIEEKHPLGRCVDIDVYNLEGRSISREEFDKKPRKCFICNEDARICVREEKHPHSEVMSYIIQKYGEYKKKTNG